MAKSEGELSIEKVDGETAELTKRRQSEARKRSLFDITQEMLDLSDQYDSAEYDGDDKPDVHEMLRQAAISGEREEKLDNYGWLIRSLESEAAAAKAVEQEFAAKRRRAEAKIDWLKDNLSQHMEAMGDKSIATGSFTFSMVVNGGKPPVLILDEDEIPPEYWDYTPKLLKSRIADDLIDGKEVPGAELGDRKSSLRIR